MREVRDEESAERLVGMAHDLKFLAQSLQNGLVGGEHFDEVDFLQGEIANQVESIILFMDAY